MRFYGLKNCDTCRKALKVLPQAEFLDVRNDGVPDAVLEAALEVFGDALINTRSSTWRSLTADDKALPRIVLLKSHPTVMKRPLIAADDVLYLGWTPDVQEALAAS